MAIVAPLELIKFTAILAILAGGFVNSDGSWTPFLFVSNHSFSQIELLTISRSSLVDSRLLHTFVSSAPVPIMFVYVPARPFSFGFIS